MSPLPECAEDSARYSRLALVAALFIISASEKPRD
jgi:hypothetical protein